QGPEQSVGGDHAGVERHDQPPAARQFCQGPRRPPRAVRVQSPAGRRGLAGADAVRGRSGKLRRQALIAIAMFEPRYNRPLHALALLTAAATFPLIFMGGLVTSHGAGMSVPDWPNSYGYNMFLFPPRLWIGGIL